MQDTPPTEPGPTRWPRSLLVLLASPFLLAVAMGVASRSILPAGSCGDLASAVAAAIVVLTPQLAGWVPMLFGRGTLQRSLGAAVAVLGPIATLSTYSSIEWIGNSCDVIEGAIDAWLALLMCGGAAAVLGLAAVTIRRMEPTRTRIAAYVVAVPVAAAAWAVLATFFYFFFFYGGGN